MSAPVPPGGVARETSGLTTRLIVRYVRRAGGDEAVVELLDRAAQGRTLEQLEDERHWTSYDHKVALFEAAAAILDQPDVGCRIGETVLREQVGMGLRVLLRSLGSPGQVVRNVARAAPKFSTAASMDVVSLGEGRATVTYEVLAPNRPHRHDCDYTRGLLSQITPLFGLPPVRVRHDECQVEGAGRCVYELRWPERRRWWMRRPGRDQMAAFEQELELLADRVLDLQSSAADLVSADEPEIVLRRLAERAGAAVQAQSYVLAVRIPSTGEVVSVHDGLSDEQADQLVRVLVDPGGDGASDESRLVEPVRSTRGRYGALATMLPPGQAFFPAERELVASYARHAAAVLDSVAAVAEARAGERTATMLLDLAQQLARATTLDEVAVSLSGAVPALVGAEGSTVYLATDNPGEYRVASASGWSDETIADLRGFAVHVGESPLLDQLQHQSEPLVVWSDTDDRFVAEVLARFGTRASAVVPLRRHGQLLGAVTAGVSWEHGSFEVTPVLLARLRGLAHHASIAIDNVLLVERIRHQAMHDPLTGLANGLLLRERANQAIAAAGRVPGRVVGLLFADLDRFKGVNDRLGHDVGDELLRQVAARLLAATRAADTVARLGGDEFVVLLPELDDVTAAVRVADKLLEVLRVPYELRGEVVDISASIGVACHPEHGEDLDDLYRRADAAMYTAKREGRDARSVA